MDVFFVSTTKELRCGKRVDKVGTIGDGSDDKSVESMKAAVWVEVGGNGGRSTWDLSF